MAKGQQLRRGGAHARALAEFAAADRLLQSLGDNETPDARWALAWCRLWRAHADYSRGAFSDALRSYVEVLPDMSAVGDDRGLVAVYRGLGNVSKYLGLYTEAADHYERSILLAKTIRDHIGRAMAEHNLGNVRLSLGDFAGAEAAYRLAARGFARTGRRDLFQHAWVNIAEAARAAGKPSVALRHLRRAELIGRAASINAGFEAERLIALGTCQRDLWRPGAARTVYERAVELAAGAGEHHIEALALRSLAEALLQEGEYAEALKTAGRALARSDTSGSATELSGTLHEIAAAAASKLGDWQSAARHFEEALSERKRLSAHLAEVRARTVELHHELSRIRHEAELARLEKARLEQALAQVAARLKSLESEERTTATEKVTPERLAPLGLSPRESEVLFWVLRGKTNPEIAIILGCSAETIKTHLKRIFRQLDVTSRAAAATQAMEFSMARIDSRTSPLSSPHRTARDRRRV